MTSCAIPDCGEEIPPHMLMCKPHWYQVPKMLRDRIWKEYKRGFGKEYFDAKDDAIAAVLEGS